MDNDSMERLRKLVEHLRNGPINRIAGDLQLGDSFVMAKALECWLIVEELRANEGASVEILCDNPDFNGQPNCVVVLYDDWTHWKEQRFGADTVLEALRAAKTVRDIAIRETKTPHG